MPLLEAMKMETEVLSERESRSRPKISIARLEQVGRKRGGMVVELERAVMFLKEEVDKVEILCILCLPVFPMPIRRSLLYMPGIDWHKIEKAAGDLDADSICMDLEDGVAINRKTDARRSVAQALQSLDFGRSERLVRINAIGTGLEGEDLAVVLPARPDGIVIPKVESGEQIQWVSDQISALEENQGWHVGAISLLAIIENAKGVVNLSEICVATPRLSAIIFGAEDLASDIGATRTQDGWEVFYARSAVVTHGAAFDLQAIDMIHIDFRDPEGFRTEALKGAQMGYAGKQLIHPVQIDLVHEAFTPDDDAIAYAQRVVEAYRAYSSKGTGAFALVGEMVDMPVVKAAQQVLEKAKLVGKI